MARQFPNLMRRLREGRAVWSRLKPRKAARAVPGRRPCPPPELAGQWVAYSADGQRIIASGATFTEVYATAHQATTEPVSFEKLPPLNRRLLSPMEG